MRKIFAIICLGALMASCSKDEAAKELLNQNTPMTFGSGISASTRVEADATTFEDDEAIKVVAFKDEANAPEAYTEDYFTYDFTYDGAKFATDLTANTDAYWTIGSKYYFYAWYPASIDAPQADETNVALPAVSGTSTGITPELLWAQAKDADDNAEIQYSGSNGWTKPSLTFKRKLGKIRFRVQYANDYTNTQKLQGISFVADRQAGSMNIFDGTISLDAANASNKVTYKTTATPTEGNIVAYAGSLEKNTTNYNALGFAPMIYATDDASDVTISDFKVTIDGQPITVPAATGEGVPAYFTVVSGKITYVLLTVSQAGIEFTSTIEAWTEGSSYEGGI